MLDLDKENQKALLLHQNKEWEKAAFVFQNLIQNHPQNGALWGNYALVLEDLKDLNAAENAFLNALVLDKNQMIRNNYAAFLMEHFNKKRHDEAFVHLNIALKKEPQNPAFWNTLGVFYVDENNLKKAEEAFQQALNFAPNYSISQFNCAQLFLKQFQFQKAFQMGRLDFKNNPYNNALRRTPPYAIFPRGKYFKGRDKKDFQNKTLLIIPEQGLGDEIQFARFIPYLKEIFKFNKIHWVCRESLVELFLQLKNIDIFEGVKNLKIHPNTFWQPHDYWCFLMDIPELLEDYSNDSFFNFPVSFPYLKNKSTVKKDFFLKNKFKVGLVWKGNPKHSNDKARSIHNINAFETLFSLPNTQWVSFQKEINETEKAFLKENNIVNLSPYLNNFLITAEYLNEINFLVSVDTVVAHLAGAMNIPTALILPSFRSDWRWGVEGNQTRWYPHHTLFRMEADGDGFLKKIHAFLKKAI